MQPKSVPTPSLTAKGAPRGQALARKIVHPPRLAPVAAPSKSPAPPAVPRGATPPSVFDDAPLETSLEYLTRPHQSWGSAVRARTLRSSRVEEHRRAVEARSCAGTSRSGSLAASIVSNMSARSAPPLTGSFASSVKSRRVGSASLRRGRFGLLPGMPTGVPVDFALGGTRLLTTAAGPVRPASGSASRAFEFTMH